VRLKFPGGKSCSKDSTIHRRASTGDIFQLIGHGDRTSTKENPLPSTWFWIASRIALRAFITLAGSESETRSTSTGAWSVLIISAIFMGKPSLQALRPPGEVGVRQPSGVVGAICPPVMP
jgi:hypothetical protein